MCVLTYGFRAEILTIMRATFQMKVYRVHEAVYDTPSQVNNQAPCYSIHYTISYHDSTWMNVNTEVCIILS